MDGVVVKRSDVVLQGANPGQVPGNNQNSASSSVRTHTHKYKYEVKLLSSGEVVKVPDIHGAIDIRESFLIFSFSDLLNIGSTK